MSAENSVSLISILIGVIAVIVSLITASSTARQSAFEKLDKYVTRLEARLTVVEKERDTLEKRLQIVEKERDETVEKLRVLGTERNSLEKRFQAVERDLQTERDERAKFEKWARRLSEQLKQANIIPVPFDTSELHLPKHK